MHALTRIVVSLIVALSFLAAGASLPASCKTCPCCAKAGADDCAGPNVHEPMGCCKMKAAVPGDIVALNTASEGPLGQLQAPVINRTVPSYISFTLEVPRPDYGQWTFESPPVYLLKSSLLC